ncbi:mucin-2 [Cylas formicarius]|uniref:mucin-2 n=1 Tax=Cylas formicarius TaxID=197179 RepID=UPI002958D796|nr:mucin-2 [Cylas formicarius]
MWIVLLLVLAGSLGEQLDDTGETDGDSSRKILGSSVVTSVSVVMDTGNGTKTVFADAVGNPQVRPASASEVASPIELLNPDRYEFYTFDDNGDLVKRLMSLEEIKSIIATGDTDAFDLDTFSSNGFVPEKRVTDIINNVQNVLKEEIETHKSPATDSKPIFDTPDVSDSWSMILPAVFGNSGGDINPEKPIVHVTADTFMVEPSSSTYSTTINLQSKNKSPTTPVLYSNVFTGSSTTQFTTPSSPESSIKVETFSNGQSTTSKNNAPEQIYFPDDQIFSTSAKISPTLSESQQLTSLMPEIFVSSSTNTFTPFPQGTFSSSSLSTMSSQSTSSPPVIPTRYSSILPSSASDVPLVRNRSTTTSSPASTHTSVQNLTTYKPATKTPLTPVTIPNQGVIAQEIPATPSTELPILQLSTLVSNNGISQLDNRFGETKTTTDSTTLSTITPEITTTIEPTTLQANMTSQEKITTLKYEKNNASHQPLGLDQNLSASEILNQLLFTTNIYEINTELNTANKNNIEAESLTTVQYNQQETSTTQELLTDSIPTEKEFNTPETTTDFSIMQSIEQLLSQAVNDADVPNNLTDDAVIQQHILENLSQTNMSDLVKESATLASQIMLDNDKMDTIERINEDNQLKTTTIQPPNTIKGDNFGSTPETLTSTSYLSIETTETSTTEKVPLETTRFADENQVENDAATETIVLSENKTPTTEKYLNLDEPARIINITIINYNSDDKVNESIQSKPANYKKHDDHEDELLNNNESLITTTEEEKDTKTTTKVDYTNAGTTLGDADWTTTLNYMITEPSTEVTSGYSSQLDEITIQTATTNKTVSPPTSTKPRIPSIVITLTKNGSSITEKTTVELNKTDSADITSTIASANIATKGTTMAPLTPHNEATWTLVSTLTPYEKVSTESPETSSKIQYPEVVDLPVPIDLVPKPIQGFGLEDTTASLDTDIYQFVQLCNELAFGFWKTLANDLNASRSIFVSPFAATSMLAMVFLGARGATSGEMNEILKLDDMVTFNPHLIFKEVSESINNEQDSGIATSVIGRELFSDKSRGKLLDFYKNRVRAFYDGYVEEVNFKEIGDVIRRRTNLLVKKHSHGRIPEFLKDGSLNARSPLAGIGVNIFETDCSQTSVGGRDGEIHFVVSPSIRQRRLIPIPAVVYKSGFLAGYEPSLDATAISLGTKDQTISTIFVIPGQQGMPGPADSLHRLEKRLVESSFRKGAWSRLLRSLIPRPGLELQIPRFSHRSIVNTTSSLQKMGLHALFDAETADLRGLNGVANELYLSDVLQINSFTTCGERGIGETHHSEVYPATLHRSRSARLLGGLISGMGLEEPEEYQRSFYDPLQDSELFSLPLSLRPRQARVPELPRLRFDRPFLYFVRHNPTGLILHMGRFNPRLLP